MFPGRDPPTTRESTKYTMGPWKHEHDDEEYDDDDEDDSHDDHDDHDHNHLIITLKIVTHSLLE